MSLLDILGNYYNSADNKVREVPDTINYTLEFSITEFRSGSISYEATATCPSVPDYSVNNMSFRATELLNIANKFIPHFSVNGNHYAKHTENFKTVVRFDNGSEFSTGYDTASRNYSEFVNTWLRSVTSLPKAFTMDVTIVRENNPDARTEACMEMSGGKKPKDYFTAILDASFDSSKTPIHKRQVLRAFKRGSIKSIILNKYTKQEVVFLFEYLYGVKVPKSATYAELFTRVASAPQSDFGIKDVQVLKKLLESITYGVVPDVTTKKLLSIGVKPATDLSRWYKKFPEIEIAMK